MNEETEQVLIAVLELMKRLAVEQMEIILEDERWRLSCSQDEWAVGSKSFFDYGSWNESDKLYISFRS